MSLFQKLQWGLAIWTRKARTRRVLLGIHGITLGVGVIGVIANPKQIASALGPLLINLAILYFLWTTTYFDR